MATKKKKRKAPKKAARTAAANKPKKRAPTKPARKKSAPKRKPKKVAKRSRAVLPLKTFAEKVRDRDPATEAWYRVGDVLSHGVVLGPGGADNVMVVSNGVVSVVPEEDLFETQAAAAAR